ncbi:bifunctional protein tyrosine phosphatase family protein/NAD(P)/FAD-dependent oxidoreductase [Acetobacter fallax]|uniref:TIGR01244 family phosphatase n=1 Tax=Acetobacter fallax TaxID=1737473 RepID=A0ABX0KDX6_9PROT|nr:bifunctional protein tyrosine phosphatase family protein/NAD(P)/FAD-dependent oxidoreductase [Acetobacter fallax]NHO33118.1 TIGR01244 family phosphatase [Acetobacter fallax]NHO36733.1 TIGR01244 family phosphatase [Acetobacter fallax]
MAFRSLTDRYSVAPQLSMDDVAEAARQGFRAIVCIRPDGEQKGQPAAAEIGKATIAAGMTFESIPFQSGMLPSETDIERMKVVIRGVDGPVLGYCRSGNRAAMLWAFAEAGTLPENDIITAGQKIGIDLSPISGALKRNAAPVTDKAPGAAPGSAPGRRFDVVVIGGGAGGLSAAAGLLRRRPNLSVAIVEPSADHFYQPGWTLVGGGVFTAKQTRRSEASLIPKGAEWIRSRVEQILPGEGRVIVADGAPLSYSVLIVAAGIVLNWGGISGLEETLGRNGVTSNYRYDLAPYTWQLVQTLSRGTALFTQPPMPIKCAGAPQKALYLSCDEWRRRGVLDSITVEFDTCTPALFGVPAFVPALMNYIRDYGVDLELSSRLVSVDGTRKVATFERKGDNGPMQIERGFDMLHVVPPQIAPAFVRDSGIADPSGFVAVNPATLQHITYKNIYALGDVAGTGNAKTAAAARKQAPVVALNALATLDGKAPVYAYDGYGGCPLTVERGKIVLAEFGYGGKLMPTLPGWILDGTKPTRLAWFLKKDVMPRLYWEMLKGHEFMVKPEKIAS